MRDTSVKKQVTTDLQQRMARQAKTKNGFAPKVCVRCGLPFEWRKKMGEKLG